MRAGRGPLGPLRAAGRWFRAVALLLALASAGAVLWGNPGDGDRDGERALPAARPATGEAPGAPPPPASPDEEEGGTTVDAPVRIPDAEAVRLLRPGDRVDVLATPADAPAGGPADGPADSARTIARNVRVAAVPDAASGPEAGPGGREGALVVLSVPRPTAARLAGAAAHSVLAVTLC
ncbi:Flp pilus assembly protein RcpC/CpaB [Streptomyces pini]|uniref:Flp pilus assembly protein RcpC/CpaB n=1 Tax=Streptomyces pini TaxID=1520580 RepID=A0A1I3U2T4_9ACTN|nr:Flp pilus assembly protein RcpC/CpaB [Streptomyces pini]